MLPPFTITLINSSADSGETGALQPGLPRSTTPLGCVVRTNLFGNHVCSESRFVWDTSLHHLKKSSKRTPSVRSNNLSPWTCTIASQNVTVLISLGLLLMSMHHSQRLSETRGINSFIPPNFLSPTDVRWKGNDTSSMKYRRHSRVRLYEPLENGQTDSECLFKQSQIKLRKKERTALVDVDLNGLISMLIYNINCISSLYQYRSSYERWWISFHWNES